MNRSRGADRTLKTAALTALALVAFAANSIICRLALRDAAIDAATFSTIRLASGAAMLLLIATLTPRAAPAVGSWPSAGLLFLYAVPFSFAYTSLSAGTGALILFGSVQLTMMSAALWSGERPHGLQWTGLGVALAGLVYLVLPGLEAPPPRGAGLMALAGCAWGLYSLKGRGATSPLRTSRLTVQQVGRGMLSKPGLAGIAVPQRLAWTASSTKSSDSHHTDAEDRARASNRARADSRPPLAGTSLPTFPRPKGGIPL